MKPDERTLLDAMKTMRPACTADMPFTEPVFVHVGMNAKRGYYLLDKWCRKNWWECGVSLRSGWLTAEGLKA